MTEQEPGSKPANPDVDPGFLEVETLTSIVRALGLLGPAARDRVVNAVLAFLGRPHAGLPDASRGSLRPQAMPDAHAGLIPKFSDDRTPTPKEFLFEKKPHTDVDRIVCLAYYLAHYRERPTFKTLDLSILNTEAAQLKFSNPAQSVENALKAGFLAPAAKGAKQLSSVGELYVQALPDRDAARAAVAKARPRRKTRRSGRTASESSVPPSKAE